MAVQRETRRPAAGRVVEEKKKLAVEGRGPVSSGRRAWEWTKTIVVAFALFIVIRTFLVEAFRIPTGSMENTLLVGDFLLVNKAVFGSRIPFTELRLPGFAQPSRGDVVVFTPPHDFGKNYVKRLVALPGDTIEMRDKALRVNGDWVDEPFARHTDPLDTSSPAMLWQCEYRLSAIADACRPTRDNWGPLLVPDGHALVLGDNRDDSEDSRYWGFVPISEIKGEPLFVYFSFDPGSLRKLPWLSDIRWRRIGETVR